jgi:GDPmannose 4,6-dehydratase
LTGDATKARSVLGWRPEVEFRALVEMMVDADIARLERPTSRRIASPSTSG